MRSGIPEGPPLTPPKRRRLRTYAFDPMSTRLSGRFVTLSIPFEHDLLPGPQGELIQVVDYDPVHEHWYVPVDLDHPTILAKDGLDPSESDPRTHQQIVYAVAMSVIERFERHLGRRFRWRSDKRLRMVPHAFEGRNAYFDPDKNAVLFGYFRADLTDPGPNLPGQTIFTCLSSDIIAHELTHALVDRLRPRFKEATNVDVFAWHEGIADLIALFQHFAYRDVVLDAVTTTSGRIQDGGALFDLAAEFGRSCGRGTALRSALKTKRKGEAERDSDRSRAQRLHDTREPHERGACFVTAVFDAYLDRFRARTADLIRIATNGTGELPPGRLHPDLVSRVTDEAISTADRFLGMIIRSIDYLPPVDVEFGDVLRAVVTSDTSLYPQDDLQLRSTLVETFRRRGIHPDGVASLSDDAVAWPEPALPLDLNSAAHAVETRLRAALKIAPRSDEGAHETAIRLVDDITDATLAAGRLDDVAAACAAVNTAIKDALHRVAAKREKDVPSDLREAIGAARRRLTAPRFAALLLDDLRAAGGPPPPVRELVLSSTMDLDPDGDPGAADGDRTLSRRLYQSLTDWAAVNAAAIGMDPANGERIELEGRHVAYRRAGDGQPRPEIVIVFTQRRRDLEVALFGAAPTVKRGAQEGETTATSGGRAGHIELLAGTTLIVRPSGVVKHVIAKPLPFTEPPAARDNPDALRFHRLGVHRLAAMLDWFDEADLADALTVWDDRPAVNRLDFATLHDDAYGEQSTPEDADDD